jgi:hypothetical protein
MHAKKQDATAWIEVATIQSSGVVRGLDPELANLAKLNCH